MKMQIIKSPREMQELAAQWRRADEQIGFVPTMGALHDGHLALARAARAENSKFVASIFVNPLQFAPHEDFSRYPRTFQRDCELLQSVGCDTLFAPTTEAMYGEKDSAADSTFVEVSGLVERWEGVARPGHFRGVATVVAKLFNIVLPHHAYFGEKDYQQLKVIERIARDLNFNLQIVPMPTVREADGLALSSRNAYLNSEQRASASALYRVLQAGTQLAQRGETDVEKLLCAMQQVLNDAPLLQVEYLAVVDAETLEPLQCLEKAKPARTLIAARAGSTRLIDNIEICVM